MSSGSGGILPLCEQFPALCTGGASVRLDAEGNGLCRGSSCRPCNRHEDCKGDLCIKRRCLVAPLCGNGVPEFGEQCDDGNTIDDDACGNDCRKGIGAACTDDRECRTERCVDITCQPCTTNDQCASKQCEKGSCVPLCGDGRIDPGEECDEGPKNSDTAPDRCRRDCRNPWCGDGIADVNEQCDDGNTVSNDGCDRLCRIEFREFFAQVPLLQPPIQDISRSRPPAGKTGPGAVAVMAAGAAAGWAWMRRRTK